MRCNFNSFIYPKKADFSRRFVQFILYMKQFLHKKKSVHKKQQLPNILILTTFLNYVKFIEHMINFLIKFNFQIGCQNN